MTLLEGKKVLVTGGSRGIGAAIVRCAMEEGAEVAFTYRSGAETAAGLRGEMEALYPEQRCLAAQCDVNDAAAMRATVERLTGELGRLDALVNNAGVTRDAAFARMTREQWDEVIETNLGGMFNATQPLTLSLIKQRSGAILNVTSAAGIYGAAGQANYAASKAGIIGLTRALSKELAPFGVRVNAIAPGFIETDMIAQIDPERLRQLKGRIPAGRLGRAEEIGQMACFLLSDRAAYVNGQVIQVDGGLTL